MHMRRQREHHESLRTLRDVRIRSQRSMRSMHTTSTTISQIQHKTKSAGTHHTRRQPRTGLSQNTTPRKKAHNINNSKPNDKHTEHTNNYNHHIQHNNTCRTQSANRLHRTKHQPTRIPIHLTSTARIHRQPPSSTGLGIAKHTHTTTLPISAGQTSNLRIKHTVRTHTNRTRHKTTHRIPCLPHNQQGTKVSLLRDVQTIHKTNISPFVHYSGRGINPKQHTINMLLLQRSL